MDLDDKNDKLVFFPSTPQQKVTDSYDQPEQQSPLPKIHLVRKIYQTQTKSKNPNHSYKLSSILQPRNAKTFLQKNKSVDQRKFEQIRRSVLLKNQKKKIEVVKNSNYAHINPKIYDKKNPEIQLPRLRPSILIPELQDAKILNDYRIISHVGKGCFSVVSAAVNKASSKRYAIKTYNRIDQMDQQKLKNIQNQVQNLFNLSHKNIIFLKHAIKDGLKIQLVMENGGIQSLSGLLRKVTMFQQSRAKKYFKQMVEALAYCHGQNICHRDIKLQNILVDQNDNIKIIDFGFSLKCNNNAKLTTYCGTPPYMSPQLSSKSPYSGYSSDVWALGVSLYLMLTGKFPFKAGNQKQLYRLIQQGKFKIQSMSPQIKQILQSMLKVDQKSRISAKQIINSKWLNNTL